jgi:hypothetical protein
MEPIALPNGSPKLRDRQPLYRVTDDDLIVDRVLAFNHIRCPAHSCTRTELTA